ncbi:MAG TPA: TetR/AcrR family transcriptional regulator C-terminal domain-containing protein [Pseudonocardia sp.]|nr:TetR/AcrR family transcriptional regulator C-terminal domain-containing protein [Pseudonocardia sp.]
MALNRDAVVRAGLGLLDEVGLEALTLRRLADRLGVRAPAIYWHVRDKRELLDEMATAMLRDAFEDPVGIERRSAPRAVLLGLADRMRAALLSRRDGGRLFGGSYLTDASLVGTTEPALRQLVEAGLALPAAVSATRTIFCYTLGFVIEEQGTHGREALFDPDARRARIDTDRFPLSAEAGEHMFGDFDALFAAGVALIVSGIAAD